MVLGACIESYLGYHGLYLTQESIIENACGYDLDGLPCNCPGTIEMITQNLNQSYVDGWGNYYSVEPHVRIGKPSLSFVYTQLLKKKPIIIAYNQPGRYGHAVIITGAVCYKIGNEIHVERLIIRDPAPNRENILNKGRRTTISLNGFINSIYAYWTPEVGYDKPYPVLGEIRWY